MPYDRRQVKLAARSAVREAHPLPQLVILVFLLLTAGISTVVNAAAAWRMTRSVEGVAAWFYSGSQDTYSSLLHTGALGTLSFFLMVLLALYTIVMHLGLSQYVLHLSRRWPASFRDLFSGFSMAGQVIALNLLILLFAFLWILLGSLVYTAVLILLTPENAFSTVVTVLLSVALLIFILNRVLRYVMANFLLLDHPELSALQLIGRSKDLMQGKICSYTVLLLSFLGWVLLVVLVEWIVWGVGSLLLGFSFLDLPAFVLGSGGGAAAQALSPLLAVPVLLAGFLATLPLTLWLTAYQRTALAGFYDAACGDPCLQAPPDETSSGYDTTLGGYSK